MLVLLQSHENKGRVVKTRWGAISFDAAGFATIEVAEDQLPLLRGLHWLVESAPVLEQPAEVVTPEPTPAPTPVFDTGRSKKRR